MSTAVEGPAVALALALAVAFACLSLSVRGCGGRGPHPANHALPATNAIAAHLVSIFKAVPSASKIYTITATRRS